MRAPPPDPTLISDNSLRLERAQSVARDDPADFETLRQILLGAEKIAGPQRLGKQGLAHLAHDTRRQGSAAKREDLACRYC